MATTTRDLGIDIGDRRDASPAHGAGVLGRVLARFVARFANRDRHVQRLADRSIGASDRELATLGRTAPSAAERAAVRHQVGLRRPI